MSEEFCVKAEHPKGGVVLLRRGFKNAEDAGDHPVIMKNWKRVWVEPIEPKKEPNRELPPMPWNIEWVAGGRTYLIDADGKKFASLLGTFEQREKVAAKLLYLMELDQAGG